MAFTGLETFSLGAQQHTIAQFQWDGGELALLPGYVDSLGCNIDQVLASLPLRETWNNQPLVDPHVRADLRDYLTTVLTPVRSVHLRPFLVERSATPLRIVRTIGPNLQELVPPPQRIETLASALRDGFRFPTSDEWEYACSGGARTLFRWGNEWPPSPWTAVHRRCLEEWHEDLKLNGFGLTIAQDPGQLEYCWEANIVRGGDGGSASSADMENYVQWLPLATAFCYPMPDFVQRNPQPYMRRIMPLAWLIEECSPRL